ncbi:MAG: type II secretion system protein [Smithellaceae bacterium]|nr:type II secretion system protein [Smithellaceae bacterium]
MIRQGRSNRGFTLIEVIVTLTIAAILGVVVYQYLGSSLARSTEPIFRLKKSFALRQVAENMTADYKRNYSANLPGLSVNIGPAGLQQSNKYGVYGVVDNKYIGFNVSNQEVTTATEQKILKVTIKNDLNETITMLFISA